MQIEEAIGKRLRELCEEKNITLSGLATKAGIHHTTVLRICTDKGKEIKPRTLEKLLDALEISPRQFYNSDIFDHVDPVID